MKNQKGFISIGFIIGVAFYGALITFAEPTPVNDHVINRVECTLPDGKLGYCDAEGMPYSQ